MDIFLQIAGSLASICAIPLSIYFFLLKELERNRIIE